MRLEADSWFRIPGLQRLAKRIKGDDPVQVVQKALSECDKSPATTLALDTILAEELWRPRFESFPDFVIGLPPQGLGVRSQKCAQLLRTALLALGHFEPWTLILERVVRTPGRPRKTLANDDGFVRFYKLPTAMTSRDRLLLMLKRHHPQHFQAVCNHECSPRQAALRAGLITVRADYYGGVCNVAAAALLTERAQARLLCKIFKVATPSAQSTFIARQIEPRLEAGLAQRWRESIKQ